MSNVIKGYSAATIAPFVIDADNSEKGVMLAEQVAQNQLKYNEEFSGDMVEPENSFNGFQEGLDFTTISEEELANRVDTLDDGETQISEAEMNGAEESIKESELVRQTLEEAQRQADEILVQAQAQAEDVKAQAELVGRQEGKEQGLLDASEEIEQIKQQLYEEQEQFKVQMQAEKDAAIDALEPEFVKVVCDLLERLTGVAVTGHKEVILYLINNALKGVDNSHNFVISLSEQDYPYVEKHKEEIYGYLNPGVKMELFQDAQLEKNQCKIETDNGLVDLSLDVQLSQLIKSLMMLNA